MFLVQNFLDQPAMSERVLNLALAVAVFIVLIAGTKYNQYSEAINFYLIFLILLPD